MRVLLKIIDFFYPVCPSGLGHRVRFDYLVAPDGKLFCFHRDCKKAFKEHLSKLQKDKNRCPRCLSEIVPEDHPWGLCIPCGGKNRLREWVRD